MVALPGTQPSAPYRMTIFTFVRLEEKRIAFLVCRKYQEYCLNSPIEPSNQACPIACDMVPPAWTPPTPASAAADCQVWLELDLLIHVLNVATGNIGAGNRVTFIWVSSMPAQSFESTTLLRDPVYADMMSCAPPLWRLSRDVVDNCHGLNMALIEHLLDMQGPCGPVPGRPSVVSNRPPARLRPHGLSDPSRGHTALCAGRGLHGRRPRGGSDLAAHLRHLRAMFGGDEGDAGPPAQRHGHRRNESDPESRRRPDGEQLVDGQADSLST